MHRSINKTLGRSFELVSQVRTVFAIMQVRFLVEVPDWYPDSVVPMRRVNEILRTKRYQSRMQLVALGRLLSNAQYGRWSLDRE